ncbi:MAG TPA: hypothetical protein PKZ32_19725 [Candidatus Melainabacteria bacterium]|nr:hypothetical protein [Candidatus Melainabacteria bacterium]
MHSKLLAFSGCLFLTLPLYGCSSAMQEIHDLNSGTKVTANSAENIQWPSDFPVPQYKGSRATVATDTMVENTRIRSALQLTKDEPSACCKFYADWFEKNGWTVKTPPMDMGVGWSTAAEKGSDNINVTALQPKGSPETTLTVNVSMKK